MNPECTVYIIDDDDASRSTLVYMIETLGMKAVSFSSAQEFLLQPHHANPSCAIVDLRMPGISGLELLHLLRDANDPIPVVLISGFAETSVAVNAMRAGAVHFLEKTASPQQLHEAVRQACTLSSRIFAERTEQSKLRQSWDSLSPDEQLILKYVAQGKLNKEIAQATDVPLRTIEDRRSRVMSKIGADSLADLIRFAIRTEQFYT